MSNPSKNFAESSHSALSLEVLQTNPDLLNKVAKPLLDIGVPKQLLIDFIAKNNITNREELIKKMAVCGMGSLWESFWKTKTGEVGAQFKKIEEGKLNEEEKFRTAIAISGAMRTALILDENLKEKGIDNATKRTKIVHETMQYHLTNFKEAVYSQGQTKEQNLPIMLAVGILEQGSARALEDAGIGAEQAENFHKNVLQLLKTYLVPEQSISSASTPEAIRTSIRNNLEKNTTKLYSLALAIAVKGRDLTTDPSTYGVDALTKFGEDIAKQIDSAPDKVLEITAELDKKFKKKMDSKLDESKEKEIFKRFLVYNLGQSALLSNQPITEEKLKQTIDNCIGEYVAGNVFNYVRYEHKTKGIEHLETMRLANAAVAPALSYIYQDQGDDKQKAKKKELENQYLKLTLNVNSSLEEKNKRIKEWQTSVLDEYTKQCAAHFPKGTELNEENRAILSHFLPKQIAQEQKAHPDKWKENMNRALTETCKLFDITPKEILLIHEQTTRKQLKTKICSSEFANALKQKGYKTDEIFRTAINIFPTLTDLALKTGPENAKTVFENTLKNLELRSVLESKYKDLSRSDKQMQTEKDFIVNILREQIAVSLNMSFSKNVVDAGNKADIYLELGEGKKIQNSNFYKILESKGYLPDNIQYFAHSLRPLITNMFLRYENADKILDNALKTLPRASELEINKDIFAPNTKPEKMMAMYLEGSLNESLRNIIASGQIDVGVESTTKIEESKSLIERDGAKKWKALDISQLTNNLWMGPEAVDAALKRFKQEIVLNNKTLSPLIKGLDIELFDALSQPSGRLGALLALRGEGERKANILNIQKYYNAAKKEYSYEEILALEKERDGIYTTLLDIAKKKAEFVKDDKSKQEAHVKNFFIAEMAKLHSEYGLDFFKQETQNLISKGFELKFNNAILMSIVTQTALTKLHGKDYRKGKIFYVGRVRDGELTEIGRVDQRGAGAGKAVCDKKSLDVKASDYIVIYTKEKGKTKLEAFTSALHYKQREKIHARYSLFVNNATNCELTMFNFNAEWNNFPITATVKKEITTSKSKSEPIIQKQGIQEELRDPVSENPYSISITPFIMPPVMSIKDIVKGTDLGTHITTRPDVGADIERVRLHNVLTAWLDGYTNPGSPRADIVQQGMITLVSNTIVPQLKNEILSGGGTFYITDNRTAGITTTLPSSPNYAKIVITKQPNSPNYDIQVLDSSGFEVIRGTITATTNELIIEKMRSYGFITAPLLRAGLGKGFTLNVDLRTGIPFEYKKHGKFLLPHKYAKGAEHLYMFPITLNYQKSGFSAYGGYIPGEYGGVMAGLGLGRSFGVGRTQFAFQAGVGTSIEKGTDTLTSPTYNLGLTLNPPGWGVFGAGISYDSLAGKAGYYLDVGGEKYKLRTTFAPLPLGQFMVIPDVIWTDNEGKEKGVVSGVASWFFKKAFYIPKKIRDRKMHGV